MMKKSIKQIMRLAAAIGLSTAAGSALAHLGHGDHAAILAAGQPHPMLGTEHLLGLSLALAAGFALYSLFRR